MAVNIDIKQLLEAGAHFGHKTSRWHPKMKPYIHSWRGGVHIIDLAKTVEALETATSFVESVAAKNRQVLFVGTKRQAQDIVRKAAEDAGQPFVTERWFGGMLTNRKTVDGRIKYLKDIEAKMDSGELAAKYNKLEVQRFQEEIDRLNLTFGGVKAMSGLPGAVFVADVLTDHIAVKEAQRLGIPVIAIVDTNANPTGIPYPIPANDDAIKSITLITSYITAAIDAGKGKIKKEIVDKDEEVKG